METPQTTFHTYAVNWTSESIVFFIDGTAVRTLEYADAVDGQNFPQTPMRLKLGNWAGGESGEPAGTVEWAGGATDFSDAPFTMYVESISITNYNPGSAYEYTDETGDYTSIKVVGADDSSSNSSSSSSGTSSSTATSSTPTSSESVAAVMQTAAAVSTTITGSVYSTNSAAISSSNATGTGSGSYASSTSNSTYTGGNAASTSVTSASTSGSTTNTVATSAMLLALAFAVLVL